MTQCVSGNVMLTKRTLSHCLPKSAGEYQADDTAWYARTAARNPIPTAPPGDKKGKKHARAASPGSLDVPVRRKYTV